MDTKWLLPYPSLWASLAGVLVGSLIVLVGNMTFQSTQMMPHYLKSTSTEAAIASVTSSDQQGTHIVKPHNTYHKEHLSAAECAFIMALAAPLHAPIVEIPSATRNVWQALHQ